MSELNQDEHAAGIRKDYARAVDLYERGEFNAAMRLCNQIVERDTSAPHPFVLGTKRALMTQQWQQAFESALVLLRTRPEFEKQGACVTELGVSYQEIAGWMAMAGDGLPRCTDGAQHPGVFFARAIHAHIRGASDVARAQYRKVLADPGRAGRLFGETINLLHALEHEAGDSVAAKSWLDLAKFPLQFKLSDFYDGDVREFCDAIFDEVMRSPLLKVTTDPQSRGWVVGDRLNDPGCGPRVKELEDVFARLVDHCQDDFKALMHDFHHPMFGKFPNVHAIKMFCAMLKGAGHVGPHLHNDGFLVGNLYVRVADEPDGDGTPNCIEFGKHLFHAATGGGYPTRQITPETGMVLIWPAYYCHNVPQSRATSPRMVVGFDLVPVAG